MLRFALFFVTINSYKFIQNYGGVMKVKCNNCDAHYVLRSGAYGDFFGCSNFPKCKSTVKISDIVVTFLVHTGLNIYKWDKQCYKCKLKTPVYSYYLAYEMCEVDECFSGMFGVGVGDIPILDKLVGSEVDSAKKQYSKTSNSSYISNACIHCNSIQGKFYVVEDPHEISNELRYRDMKKFLYKNISVTYSEELRIQLGRYFDPEPRDY